MHAHGVFFVSYVDPAVKRFSNPHGDELLLLKGCLDSYAVGTFTSAPTPNLVHSTQNTPGPHWDPYEFLNIEQHKKLPVCAQGSLREAWNQRILFENDKDKEINELK
ncbi:hypothetical protein VNO77_23042 [Canavalia gladiata]|uniref:Uncharacterized protein n=1 Tax=Canavalia gladiata TaxID=3824 RepID=A0AAN9QBD5_CANGL